MRDNTSVARAKEESRIERQGMGYYAVDESYDKRVYENTFGNVVVIILVFAFFYAVNILFWWGQFELGINHAHHYMIWCIAIFVASMLYGIFLLVSGKFSNRIKRKHAFLMEIIAEKKAARDEEENRKRQDAEYKKNIIERDRLAA